MRVGDIVSRKSYNNDVNFIIEDITNNKALLSGLHYRLTADALVSDLEVIGTRGTLDAKIESNMIEENRFFFNHDAATSKNTKEETTDEEQIPPLILGKRYAKILHIDATDHYLNECLIQYIKLGLSVVGFSIPEEKQPLCILGLLSKYQPNIVVITGHDAIGKQKDDINKVSGYLNSKYFIESIKIARKFNPNYDELVIIAGGCKSYYEALMDAGANFASSPSRVLISVTEPVTIACILATTSIQTFISVDLITQAISSGIHGFGGLETRGQCRELKPKY